MDNEKVQECKQRLILEQKEQNMDGLLVVTERDWEQFIMTPFMFDKEEKVNLIMDNETHLNCHHYHNYHKCHKYQLQPIESPNINTNDLCW